MGSNFQDYKKKFFGLAILIFAIIFLVFLFTYALKSDLLGSNLITKIIHIDEDAYGETLFNSEELNFRPILDNQVDVNSNNVIYIPFVVGGASDNNIDHIVYDIALADLKLDCSLVSPYLKWKLVKNGELLSEGSLDYHFDTIKDGRLVLTPIQQDLQDYSKDKSTYDHYDFYMWISDYCQSENLTDCLNNEDQNFLFDKKISGKIEVELYAEIKETLIRTPSDQLNTDYCEVGSGDAIYVDG